MSYEIYREKIKFLEKVSKFSQWILELNCEVLQKKMWTFEYRALKLARKDNMR